MTPWKNRNLIKVAPQLSLDREGENFKSLNENLPTTIVLTMIWIQISIKGPHLTFATLELVLNLASYPRKLAWRGEDQVIQWSITSTQFKRKTILMINQTEVILLKIIWSVLLTLTDSPKRDLDFNEGSFIISNSWE